MNLKIYDTQDVKEIIEKYETQGKDDDIAALCEVYTLFPNKFGDDFGNLVAEIKRDLKYDPNPYISTMDYTPSDRVVGAFNKLCCKDTAKKISAVIPCKDNALMLENYFRWHAGEVVRKVFDLLGDDAEFRSVFSELKKYAEYGEYRAVCALSWYVYALLVKHGYVTATENGLLLRRVNCRPWGLKFYSL